MNIAENTNTWDEIYWSDLMNRISLDNKMDTSEFSTPFYWGGVLTTESLR